MIGVTRAKGLVRRFKKILRPRPRVRNKHSHFQFRALNHKGMHTFFGYYDRTPWSPSGDKLLLCATPINGRPVQCEDSLLILYYDLVGESFKELALSRAWNYQKGAEQQWVDDNKIVYNDVQEQAYVTKSVCLDSSNPVVEFGSPIAAYHQRLKVGISIDFERLRVLESDYGYPLLSSSNQLPNQDISVKLLDFESKTAEVIVSFEDIVRAFPRSADFERHDFWVNHPKFNPSGDKLLFVVRSRPRNDHRASRDFSDLFVLDLRTKQVKCVFDHDHWSRGSHHPFWWGGHHPIWYDDDHILMNWRVDTQMRYTVFEDISEGYRVLAPRIKATGHPSVDSTRQFLLTDDYPKDGYRGLKLISVSTGQEALLGEFYSPETFKNEWSCDLHPRWKDGQLEICFDSAHKRVRSTCVARLTCDLICGLLQSGLE